MRTTIIATFTTTLLLLQTSQTANAYELGNPRSGNSTTLYASPDIALTLPDHFESLENAANKLNANPSTMRLTLATDNDYVVAGNNGESEVAMVPSGAAGLCGSIACTLNWSAGGTIVESDVYFDMSHDWATTDLKAESKAYAPGEGRPLLNTALHEFSHALGLKHEADVFNVLGNAWNVVSTNGLTTESVISEDTSNGLIAHYGERVDINEDLSLYHWHHVGSSNGYSNHGRTAVTDIADLSLAAAAPFDPSLNEPAWYVTSGQQIKVEQTAENRGTAQTVTIKWYLSTNSTITTSDTLLATSSITKGRNGPYTWTRTLTLPANLNGRYWVGAIIDSEDVLAEQNEINNAIYIAELVAN